METVFILSITPLILSWWKRFRFRKILHAHYIFEDFHRRAYDIDVQCALHIRDEKTYNELRKIFLECEKIFEKMYEEIDSYTSERAKYWWWLSLNGLKYLNQRIMENKTQFEKIKKDAIESRKECISNVLFIQIK